MWAKGRAFHKQYGEPKKMERKRARVQLKFYPWTAVADDYAVIFYELKIKSEVGEEMCK